MNKSCLAIVLAVAIFSSNAAFSQVAVKSQNNNYIKQIRQLLQQIIDVNLRYEDKFHEFISEAELKQQQPNTTLVLCSDSRVDSDAINDVPAGKVFVVRNIGNQILTAYGSVEYGITKLDTPLLLIVGHSGCGAIKAAMADYTNESMHIKQELVTIEVDDNDSLNNNIVKNINNQVKIAVNQFNNRVKDGSLVVVGMLYDLHNEFGYGNGHLILVNVNNQTDPKQLTDNPYIKDLHRLTILGMKDHQPETKISSK